jgi:hypothetical protein
MRHLRFGHGVTFSDKPSDYCFLPELTGAADTQVLIEAVQPSLVPQEMKYLPRASGPLTRCVPWRKGTAVYRKWGA